MDYVTDLMEDGRRNPEGEQHAELNEKVKDDSIS